MVYIKHQGKRWILYRTKRLKSRAKKIAESVRRRGCNVRVVKKRFPIGKRTRYYYYVLKRGKCS